MDQIKIGVVGLGYVGLPLAVAFAKHFNTFGYDINAERINQLEKGIDSTKELKKEAITEPLRKNKLKLSTNHLILKEANFLIITVPTPININNQPDLTALISASKMIGTLIKKEDVVIYESTVYPGLTEEICIPIIEKESGLKLNTDFSVGYSPERINPGDKIHTLENIKKIVSASSPKSLKIITKVYSTIIKAGVYQAPSIKVAEAAKVIENTQRDINIAFINELSKIFNLMGIDTLEVLEAANTKWNFINFRPGLVGGHCIGVDPYYLAFKSQEYNYNPEIILAGRRLNNGIGKDIVERLLKKMTEKKIEILNSKCLILGFTFKENCPDIRNTRVIDIYNNLKDFSISVDVYDPVADENEIFSIYNIRALNKLPESLSDYSSVIIAVNHDVFKKYKLRKDQSKVIFDVKGALPIDHSDLRL